MRTAITLAAWQFTFKKAIETNTAPHGAIIIFAVITLMAAIAEDLKTLLA